jgi:hypothetical protein
MAAECSVEVSKLGAVRSAERSLLAMGTRVASREADCPVDEDGVWGGVLARGL